MMKWILSFTCCLALSSWASAQKNPQALDVLSESEQALGLRGVELRTLVASGTLRRLNAAAEADPRSFRVKVIDLRRVRWEFDTPRGPSVTVVEHNGGWNQFRGERRALPLGQISGLGLERLPLLGLLRLIRSDDVRIFPPETEQVGNVVCLVLRLHRLPPPGAGENLRSGFERMTSAELAIDAQTFLPVRLSYREQPRDWRSDTEVLLEFRGYQETDGRLFPKTVIRTRNGVPSDQMDFERIRPNAQVVESDFRP